MALKWKRKLENIDPTEAVGSAVVRERRQTKGVKERKQKLL